MILSDHSVICVYTEGIVIAPFFKGLVMCAHPLTYSMVFSLKLRPLERFLTVLSLNGEKNSEER